MTRKVPFSLKLLQATFGITEKVFPSYAHRWAVKLFLTPVRLPFTSKGKQFLSSVETFSFRGGDYELVGYRKGAGPAVICVHGWAGKASQFGLISDAIVEAGYTFIGFDAWAHGQSKGKQASLVDFVDALRDLLSLEEEAPKAVIGHSLGAAAISLLAEEGVELPKFICMGAPTIGDDILETFRKTINGSPAIKEVLRKASLEKFNRAFDSFAMTNTFSLVNSPVLAIHGENDVDVGIFHLDRLLEIKPDIETMRVPKLGHRRILKDKVVINRIIEFIGKDN